MAETKKCFHPDSICQKDKRKASLVGQLVILRDLGEEAVTKAKEVLNPGEPINWGDLHCIIAEQILDSEGEENYRLLIEEASPYECPELCKFVGDYLQERGHIVEVLTEW